MTAWQRASDAELISAVRGDDLAAWAELCHRHLGAARRLARTLVSARAADELVARVAERVLAELLRGEGPDVAFRPHLLAQVSSEPRPSVVPLRGVPAPGGAGAGSSRPAIRAFRALPERWQLVLWHVVVERDLPTEVAPLIGASARSVPAIAGRARAGLRAATLDLHAREADEPHPDCERTRQQLPAYLRGAVTRRESTRIATHLQGCTPCREIHDEVVVVDDDLAGILAPLVLGTAETRYLTPRRPGPAARLPGRAAVAGVAAAVALITGVALSLGGGADDPPTAEAPVLGSPDLRKPLTESGVILAPSASGEPDDRPPRTTPSDLATTPGSTPPTATPTSPPASGAPTDDSTITPPDPSVPPSSPPPPTTPPPTTPPPPSDPAVSARFPRSTGPVARIEILVDDAADTDGQLTIEPKSSDVELFLDQRCTPVEGTRSSVCDLSRDASPIEIFADLRQAGDYTLVEFGITPNPGVETTPDQLTNNRVVIALPPPLED